MTYRTQKKHVFEHSKNVSSSTFSYFSSLYNDFQYAFNMTCILLFLKVRLSPSKKFIFIYFISCFCPDILVMQKSGLIRKLWFTSKFMTSQTRQQIITTHILPDVSRSKSNDTLKFGQLVEHNMSNIFLEKLYTKCGGEANPRPFYKNQN